MMSTDAIRESRPPTRRWPDALRLLAFVSGVMVLFIVARQGQSQPVVYFAFAAFLVAATLWVRGLDDNWVEKREDFRDWRLFVGVLVVPAVVTIAMATRRDDWKSTLILGGLITFYIAAGLGVRKLRWWVIVGRPHAASPRIESVLDWLWTKLLRWSTLFVLIGAAYLGYWILGWSSQAAGLLLLAAVPAPAALHVLSESRIKALSDVDQDDQSLRWMIGGLAMLGSGLVVAALFLGQTYYLLAAVIVVALLTWALAVGSLADIAAVLAVLALMGVTPGSQEVKPAILSSSASQSTQTVLVSLGDSYSSGEGAARYLDETNVAGGNQCRRAATAWPVLVAQAMGADRLVFRACSGARARNVVGHAEEDEQYAGEGIQVDQALKDVGIPPTVTPALVVVSIGGNDSGFRQVGSSCLSMRSCDDAEVSKLFYDNLDDVESALRATYLAIAAKFPHSPIAVMPYPDAFATDDGCVRAPVEEGDIRFVRSFTDELDTVIEKVASETGVYYVEPMRSALVDAHLALCDESNTPGLNFLDLRGVGGAALNRFNPGNWIHNSLHPNERGHAALAAAFSGWLSSQRRADEGTELSGLAALMSAEDKRAADDVDKPTADPVPTKSTTTLCFEKSGGNCAPKADAWALRQLGPGTFPAFLLAAWVAIGTWFMSVGLSALRFRRVPRR